MGVALSAILLFSMASSALAQEKFSARVLAKGSNSNILILMKNSGLSTSSVYSVSMIFTQGTPMSSVARGWNMQHDGNTLTFTATRGPLNPGGTSIFLIKVDNPAASAFDWSVSDSNGKVLQSGQVPKIRVRESKPTSVTPIPSVPEITVNQVRVNPGGQVIVTGKGFSALSSVEIFLENQHQLTSTTSNGNGEFNTVAIIPNDIAPGSHLINAKDTLGKSSLIQILVELVPGQEQTPGVPQGQLILTVKTDKTEYTLGDTIKITGTAVLESPISLQITDPTGGIICGSNPHVNNYTMTWEAVCFVPLNAPGGTYVLQAKQLVHKTGVRFTVKGTTGSGGTPGVGGEDPGTLKMSTDKATYKTGEVVNITVQGARPKSIVQIVVLVPSGPPLEAKQETADDNGVATHTIQLVAAQQGVYKISAKQDKYVVRGTFEVVP